MKEKHIKKRIWQLVRHALKHGDELHSLIVEGMILESDQEEDLE